MGRRWIDGFGIQGVVYCCWISGVCWFMGDGYIFVLALALHCITTVLHLSWSMAVWHGMATGKDCMAAWRFGVSFTCIGWFGVALFGLIPRCSTYIIEEGFNGVN